MPKFDDYTQKNTPEDNDITLILDKTANVNKKTPFSGIWTWIVNKMTNAVIQNLQTSNKTMIGAINELNSKSNRFYSHERISDSADLIEELKTYEAGINVVYTNSTTKSLPNPETPGSALVISCVINKGLDALIILKKVDTIYQGRIADGVFGGWSEV